MPAVHAKTASPCSLRFIMTDPQPHPVTPAPTTHKWRVTPAQKERLLKAFDEEPYPNPNRKAILAAQLGVTGTQVSKWFQHRRESLTRLGQFKAQYNRSRRTDRELAILQRAYEEDSYPSADRLAQLQAELVNVTAKQIKLWFKHRRKQSRHRSQQQNAANASKQHPSPPRPPGPSQPRPPGAAPGSAEYHAQSAQGAVANAAGPAAVPPFSHLELMALRGALCMSKQFPQAQGMQTLATFLGRPLEQLHAWFAEELRGGFFWNYLADIDAPTFGAAVASPAASGAAPPVAFSMSFPGHPAAQPAGAAQPLMRPAAGPSDDVGRVKPVELKGAPATFAGTPKWPLTNPPKLPDRDGQRPTLVPFQQQPVLFHADPYALSHQVLTPHQVQDPSAPSPVAQDKNHQGAFPQYQPVWYCAPGNPQSQIGYGSNRTYLPPASSAAMSPISGDGSKK